MDIASNTHGLALAKHAQHLTSAVYQQSKGKSEPEKRKKPTTLKQSKTQRNNQEFEYIKALGFASETVS